MKICVLQPDYSPSKVDYQYYDPIRNLTDLLPDAQVDHVLINKLTTYKQLKELRPRGSLKFSSAPNLKAAAMSAA